MSIVQISVQASLHQELVGDRNYPLGPGVTHRSLNKLLPSACLQMWQNEFGGLFSLLVGKPTKTNQLVLIGFSHY